LGVDGTDIVLLVVILNGVVGKQRTDKHLLQVGKFYFFGFVINYKTDYSRLKIWFIFRIIFSNLSPRS
jgi:hypothetical protein